MTDVTFRWARPEDADAVVPLMHESSARLIDFSFELGRGGPLPLLKRDFLRGQGIFGFKHQVVGVTADGAIVATMTGYPGGRFRDLAMHTMEAVLRHFGPWGFLRWLVRSLAMARLFIDPRSDGYFIANACVASTQRGSGLFSGLLAFAAGEAQRLGLRWVELDVSFSNVSAQTKYTHLGFVVTAERPYRGSQPIEGFRRMARAVAPAER